MARYRITDIEEKTTKEVDGFIFDAGKFQYGVQQIFDLDVNEDYYVATELSTGGRVCKVHTLQKCIDTAKSLLQGINAEEVLNVQGKAKLEEMGIPYPVNIYKQLVKDAGVLMSEKE